MAFNFPDSPTPGTVYAPAGGPSYTWDGTKWMMTGGFFTPVPRRNRIANPSMSVSQENGTTAGSTTDYYAADQWSHAFTAGIVASLQTIVSPTPAGSTWRLRMIVTTAKASLAAGDYLLIFQRLEGLRLNDLQWPTAAGQPIVVRFMFKGPAGTYTVILRTGSVDASYVKEFTITAGQANTDTIQTMAIPAPTIGTWPVSGLGAYFGIHVACGTTFQGVAGWQTGDKRGTATQSNGAATVNNTFEFGDVGLYADPNASGIAPVYEVPDYAEELAACQRYFYIGPGSTVGTIGQRYGPAGAGNMDLGAVDFPVQMRTSPTISSDAPTYTNSSALVWVPTSVGVAARGTVTALGVYRALVGNVNANARM